MDYSLWTGVGEGEGIVLQFQFHKKKKKKTYTDDKGTDEGRWKPQFVCICYQATTNDCGSIACKSELRMEIIKIKFKNILIMHTLKNQRRGFDALKK